jgi:hypothetical protein
MLQHTNHRSALLLILFLLFTLAYASIPIRLQSGVILAGEHNNLRAEGQGRRYQQRMAAMRERAKRGVSTRDQIDDETRFVYLVVLKSDADALQVGAQLGCDLKLIETDAFVCYTTSNMLQREDRVTWFSELPPKHRLDNELKGMIKNKNNADKLHVTLAQGISALATSEDDRTRYRLHTRSEFEHAMSQDLLQRIENTLLTNTGVTVTAESPQSDRIVITIHYPATEYLDTRANIFARVVKFLAQQTFVEFVEKRMNFAADTYFASKVSQSGLLTSYVNNSKSIYMRGITGAGQV